mgnify:CR=1 FL=1
MDHENLKLQSVNKMFEFERISREIDSCDDVNKLKDISKCYVKLYFALEEMMQSMNLLVSE